MSRVSPDSNYGLASLNLTNIRESDQGWYECKVVFLNRNPGSRNGTWFHLDVHGKYNLMVITRDADAYHHRICRVYLMDSYTNRLQCCMCQLFLFIVENLYNVKVNIGPDTVMADPYVALDSVKCEQETSLEM